ncbi:MAG: GAF domain-containing protein [Mesorhizobium sp.]|nr:GAF domain-containing protein [Mesorhizobium sp.]MBL8575752.1 GAF domain-containing protein [Mesorhizobium sp.]
MAKGARHSGARPSGRFRIPLSLKFAAVVSTLVALLLLAGGALSLWRSYEETQRSALAIDQQKAVALAQQVEGLMSSLENQLAWTAQPDWKTAGLEQQQGDFARILRQFPAVTELVYINNRGLEQLKVSRLVPDSVASQLSRANEPRFKETVESGTWFGPIYVRNGADLASTVGVAHTDGGVTVAELDLAFLGEPVKAATAAGGGQAFIVDGSGRLIAHTERYPVSGDNDLSALSQVKTALAVGGTGTFTDATGYETEAPAFAAYAQMPRLGWMAFVQTPEEQALAPFRLLLWQTLLLLGIGVLSAAIVGIWLARRVAKPIDSLRASTERIAEGDLTQRVAIQRRDEIGALAENFNAMASRLQQSQRGLAARADERALGLDVTLQQQTLTAGVLKAIGQSGQNLDSILETLVSSAVELCDAARGSVWLVDGRNLRLAAQAGYSDDWLDTAKNTVLDVTIDANSPQGLAAYLGQLVSVEDLPGDHRFSVDSKPGYAGDRAGIAVPMQRDNAVEGVIWLSHQEMAPFTDRQAGLAHGFADQGLIAIENARLSSTIDERDRKITRMRAEQNAMAYVAHVASAAPGDATRIFDALVETASKVPGAVAAYLIRLDTESAQVAAQRGLTPEAAARLAGLATSPELVAAKALAAGEAVEITGINEASGQSALSDSKSAFAVPLLKQGSAIGVLAVERSTAESLAERHGARLKALADQALVAIETVQLAETIERRDGTISDMRAEQASVAALADVATKSSGDPQAVFDAAVATAIRSLGATAAYIVLFDGESLRLRAHDGLPADATEKLSAFAPTMAAAQAFSSGEPFERVEIDAGSGLCAMPEARSVLALPLILNRSAIGAIAIERTQAGTLPQRHVELLRVLGDQILVAIENARLTDTVEERDRTIADMQSTHAATVEKMNAEQTAIFEQMRAEQTGMADVVRVAAGSPSDAGPVLRAIVETASKVFGSASTRLNLFDGTELRLAASGGSAQAFDEDASGLGAAAAQAFTSGSPVAMTGADGNNNGDTLAIALTNNGASVGALSVERSGLVRFEERHGEFLTALGDQAVAAVETARLSTDLDTRSAELANALERRDFAAGLVDTISAPSVDLRALSHWIASDIAAACGAYVQIFRRAGDLLVPLPASSQAAPDIRSFVERIAASDRSFRFVDTSDAPEGNETMARSVFGLPLISRDEVVGILALSRTEASPFSEEDAAKASVHAQIAAIAIEKVILLEQAEMRRQEIAAALLQKSAAAETLKIVARAPFDLQATLQHIAATASAACNAEHVLILRRLHDGYHPTAASGVSDEDWNDRIGRVASALADEAEAQGGVVLDGSPDTSGSAASTLAVSLLQDGTVIGALIAIRSEASAFTPGEIELAESLADEAAVAIAKTDLESRLADRTGKLEQALSHNVSTREVVAIAGRSISQQQPTFEAIVAAAARECDADAAVLLRTTDGEPQRLSSYGDIDPAISGLLMRRVATDARPLHVAELSAEPEFAGVNTRAPAGATLAIPLIRDGATIGAMAVLRWTSGQFGDRQAELAEVLAGQAQIALVGADLHDAFTERSAQFSASLDRQRAVTDIARLASQAGIRPGFNIDGLLKGMTDAARRLGASDTAAIYLRTDDGYRLSAADGMDEASQASEAQQLHTATDDTLVGRAALAGETIHLPDLAMTEGISALPAYAQAALSVPLMRSGQAAGVFVLTRAAPGVFQERQVELVQTFADQAVVAIDGARLTKEVASLTSEIADARLQQDAVADIASATSAAAFDLTSLLQSVLAAAVRLCDARTARLYLKDDNAFGLAAALGITHEQRAFENANPTLPGDATWLGHASAGSAVVHLPEVSADAGVEMVRFGETGSALCVPLLRGGEAVGLIALARSEAGAFHERQIELVRTFADQAAIAMENTRLLDETGRRSDEVALLLEKLDAARRRLSESERLAALGEATAGIMHEVRAPVTFVSEFGSRSQVMLDDVRSALEAAIIDQNTRGRVEELADALADNIKEGAEYARRADSIIRNMIEHAREGGGEHRMVDINTVVDESLGLAYHGARAERRNFDIALEKAFDPGAGTVDLYPQDITRVLLNLIANGFDATEERGAANGSGYQPVLAASTRNLGDAVEIRIRDNGTGISDQVRTRVFEPFFTTKPAGLGAGLGLSLSRDIIVKQHAGTIEIETEQGAFTEVRIVLPRSAASLAIQAAEVEAAALEASQEAAV